MCAAHINTCHVCRIFIQSITIDTSDFISWSKCINNNSLKRSKVQANIVNNVSISTTTIIDNSPVLSSKYPLLESLFIETSESKK